jgi:hypothetical protein
VTDIFARFSELKVFFGDVRTAYDYFYTLDLNGENILITLGKIYQAKGILGLFGQGFDYVQKHEEQIRYHIQRCETT